MVPAICPNGTRSQWARYLDQKCRKPLHRGGLVDIQDRYINTPPSLGDPETEKNTERVVSMAFRCSGLPSENENHKLLDPGPALLQTFNRVTTCEPSTYLPKDIKIKLYEVDTCYDAEGLSMQLVLPAVCQNGEKALFAIFNKKKCRGFPSLSAVVGQDFAAQ